LFPLGTVLQDGLMKHESSGPLYEVTVGIHKDHTVSLYVHKDTVEENPKYFEKVEE